MKGVSVFHGRRRVVAVIDNAPGCLLRVERQQSAQGKTRANVNDFTGFKSRQQRQRIIPQRIIISLAGKERVQSQHPEKPAGYSQT